MTNAEEMPVAANTINDQIGRKSRRQISLLSFGSKFVGHELLFVQLTALVLACIAASECHGIVKRTAPNAPLLPSIIYGLALWYWWGVAASIIWKLAERSGKDFFSASAVIRHTLLAVVFAGLHPWLLQQTIKTLISKWPVLDVAGYGSLDYLNWNRFFFELLLYGFIFGITGVIRLQLSSQREAMRTLSLEQQLSTAHLRALQMQIEPHFLFNTLNAITSLIESDRRQEALRMLQHLNNILTSTFRHGSPGKVTLAEELELIDHYLSIEEVRFADRMRVGMTIDPDTLDGKVPRFLLQPMVENAIRHGISRSVNGGAIEVRAERQAARLHLAVTNSGPDTLGTRQAGHGIGLQNTRERLSHLYGKDHHFHAQALATGGSKCKLTSRTRARGETSDRGGR